MKKNDKKNGYTIIETMIAVSLFIVVVMIGIGALLNANLLHQKSQNLRSIMDNLSFIMEDMSRNLRTGYNYHCYGSADTLLPTPVSDMSIPKSCASGYGISFELAKGNKSDVNDQWLYYVFNGGIWKSTGPYIPWNSANQVRLTPKEVTIDAVSGFSVLGAESVATDSQQPFITIRLVGKIIYQNVETPFSLQTSVSQRLIDVQI